MGPRETSELPGNVTTVVVGGSQCGLATGYHLRQHDLDFVILDGQARVGDSWRRRWDSLTLFTPRRYSSLPGLELAGDPKGEPTKDELADYLETYAATFELPVRLNTHVTEARPSGDGWVVTANERQVHARNVVIATGAFQKPYVPDLADELGRDIVQLHSDTYRHPSQLQPGGVLVVGAGASGSEIARDLAAEHEVWLSGRHPGPEPSVPVAIMWFFANHIANIRNPLFRKMRRGLTHPPAGIPHPYREQDILAAGVKRVGRTDAVDAGRPVADGEALPVTNVVWCTGYRPDYRWIEADIFDEHGWPEEHLGVATADGLYFMGLLGQRAISSSLVGGAGRDAKYIVNHIARTRPRAVSYAAQ